MLMESHRRPLDKRDLAMERRRLALALLGDSIATDLRGPTRSMAEGIPKTQQAPLVAALMNRDLGVAGERSREELVAALGGRPADPEALPTRRAARTASIVGEGNVRQGAERLGMVLGEDGLTPAERERRELQQPQPETSVAQPQPQVEAPKRRPAPGPMEPWASPEDVERHRATRGKDAEDYATMEAVATRGNREQLAATLRSLGEQRGVPMDTATSIAGEVADKMGTPAGPIGVPMANPMPPSERKKADPPLIYMRNQGATRRLPITDTLASRITEGVTAVYGPGYTVEVYSGGQPSKGSGGPRTGSIRHDDGRAADIYVYDPAGHRIRGDQLAPLAQWWRANDVGGVGLEMRGGGIHLDEHDHRKLGSGYGPHWSYGGLTEAQAAAIRAGQSGEMPKLFRGGEYTRVGDTRLADGAMPRRVGDSPLPSPVQRNMRGELDVESVEDEMRGAPQPPAMSRAPQGGPAPMMARQAVQRPAQVAASSVSTAASPAQPEPLETTVMGSAMPDRERLAKLLKSLGQGVAAADPGMTAPATMPIRQIEPQTEVAAAASPVAQGPNVRPIALSPQGVPSEESIDRRRKLAEAMLAESSGMRSIRHPLQGLAQMAQAGVGAAGEMMAQRDADARRKALTQALMGVSGVSGDNQMAQLFQADPELAFKVAQQQQALERERQQAETERIRESNRRAQERSWSLQDSEMAHEREKELLRLREEVEGPDLTTDQQNYTFARQQWIDAGNDPAQFPDITTWMRENRRAGAANQTVDLGEGDYKLVRDRADAALGAVREIATTHEARRLLDSAEGGIFGAAANVRLTLAKVGDLFGVVDPAAIENTETFVSTIADNVLTAAERMAGALSEGDMRFLQAAKGGNITLNEGSLRRILAIGEKAATRTAIRFNQAFDEMAASDPRLQQMAPMLRVELPPLALPPDDMRLDEWVMLTMDEREAYIHAWQEANQ